MNLSWERPTWSPDGQWLAVVDNDGLYKVSSDGSAPAVETLDTGLASAPAWSWDGDWVAYTRWDDNHRLYRARPDTNEVVCLTQTGDYLSPAWSPDGMQLVCEKVADGRNQLVLIDAETGDETPLTDDYFDNVEPSFSPDGQWIVYAKTDHTGFSQIYKVRPDGEEETCLTSGECNHRSPQVSPDGCWVSFTTWPTDEVSQFYDCSVVEAVELGTGDSETLTDGDSGKDDPVWSADGTEVVYSEELPEGADAAGPRSGIRRVRVNLPKRPGREDRLPEKYELLQNVPNPFCRRTLIRFGVPVLAQVRLQVYDLTGRMVRVLVREARKPGYYTVVWDGKDNLSRDVSAGVYFYELRASGRMMERKMLLLK